MSESSQNRPQSELPSISGVLGSRGRLITPTVRTRNKNEEKKLFQTHDLENRSLSFDIAAPAADTGDVFLEEQNRGLYAFRNMTAKGSRNSAKTPTQPRAKTAMGNSSVLVRNIKKPQPGNPKVATLERAKQYNELEKLTIDFKEDPMAYFSKRKDGRGHRFIYLIYKLDPQDPEFNPYDLQKVPFSQCGRDYFMMSATGVTHYVDKDSTDTIPLDQWSSESSNFMAIRKLKIFAQYFYWKSFRTWKQYVMEQRHGAVSNVVVLRPFFRNKNFVGNLINDGFEIEKLNQYIEKYLITLGVPSQSYRVEAFKSMNHVSQEELKNNFSAYMQNVVTKIRNLYATISDPKLVQVFDTDFQKESRRRNPNLNQSIMLEKKKAQLRAQKTEKVNQEIMNLGSYIRIIDYMILEALTAGCIKTWHTVDNKISQDLSSIFSVEVYFTPKGEVALKPTKNELLEAVSKVLDDSIKVLSDLPRIIKQNVLLPHLRDGGVDIMRLYNDGPTLYQMVRCTSEVDDIEKHIMSVLGANFDEAITYSQSTFSEYFPIYQLAQTWKASDYLVTRAGKPYTGTLRAADRKGPIDQFLLEFDNEPVIDFVKVQNDMHHFKSQVVNVQKLPLSGARGAIIIDSHEVKEFLEPVLTNTINSLNKMLKSLVTMKIELIEQTLKMYMVELLKEPHTLQHYVKLCELIQKTTTVTPNIEKELNFIEKSYDMFDHFGLEYERNTLQSTFNQFKADQNAAKAMKNAHFESFTKPLNAKVKELEEKLQLFYEKATNLPSSIKDSNVDEQYPQAKALNQQIVNTRVDVDQILYYQKTIGANITNLDLYNAVVDVSVFAVKLYEALQVWNTISVKMRDTPLTLIDIEDFKKSVTGLLNTVTELSNTAKITYNILVELFSCVQETAGFLNELELIVKGRMRQQNWIALFKATGNPPSQYHENITINELSKLGILKAKDKIAEITHTSRGEYEIFSQFEKVSSEWQKVQMPFVEVAFRTEDTLKLGNIKPVISIINSNINTYTQMFLNPFVGTIKDEIIKELSELEYHSHVLEAWSAFQSNWNVLSSLFSSEETRQALPHQNNRIISVQRKWIPIGKHALKDTRVVAACNYPQLQSVLEEMNQTLESVLSSLGKFLDTKRTLMPRLYFLSNEDTLSFLSTNSYDVLAPILCKLFMGVAKLDVHESEASRSDQSSFYHNIQRMKIYGLIGEDGSTITFQRHISCNMPQENWMKQLLDAMKATVHDLIANNIGTCNGPQLSEWFTSLPSYISYIVLNATFCREVSDIVKVLENNQDAAIEYKQITKQRIEDAATTYNTISSPVIRNKLSLLLTTLIGFRDRFESLLSVKGGINQTEWQQTLRFVYSQTSATLKLEFAGVSWDHEYEYYGQVPRVIHSASIDSALHSTVHSMANGYTPIIIGHGSCGKTEILRHLAANFGKYLYIFYPSTTDNDILIGRAAIGTASSGAWCVISDIDTMPHHVLSVLHDTIRNHSSAIAAGNARITLCQRFIDLSKTSRIFLTSDSSYEYSTNIPQQLRAFVRSVAIRDPEYKRVCSIKLMALGFHDVDDLAKKLSSVISTIIQFFAPGNIKISYFNYIVKIISFASKKLQVCETEDLALAYATFRLMHTFVDKENYNKLASIINAGFQVVAHNEEFLNKVKEFDHDEALASAVEKEVKLLGIEIPTDYLVSQTMALYRSLVFNQITILVGPQNSGKSTAVQVLQRALNRDEILDKVERAKKLVYRTIYHESDIPSCIFGKCIDDPQSGFAVIAGLTHATHYALTEITECCYKVIRFVGNLHRHLMKFLVKFTSIPANRNIRFIIETPSLEGITPSIVSRAGIVQMKNLQASVSFDHCALEHPLLPFSLAMQALSTVVNVSKMEAIRTAFCNYIPSFITKLYSLENNFASSATRITIPGGNLVLSNNLTHNAAILSLYALSEFSEDCESQENINMVLGWSFMTVVSAYIDPSQHANIERFIKSTLSIEIPDEWSGFNVSQDFVKEYSLPSLKSLVPENSKLVPIKEPQDKYVYALENINSPPINLNNVIVIPYSWINDLNLAILYLKVGKHLIVHGHPGSGKSSFVKAAIRTSGILQRTIFIKVTPVLTGEVVTAYIKNHTALTALTVQPEIANITFILVFDNITPQDTMLISFISQIIDTKEIPIFSKTDHKVYEVARLRNFRVVLTTNNFYEMPTNFICKFSPVQVDNLSINSASYISSQLLKLYGMDEKTSTYVIDYFTKSMTKLGNLNISQSLIKASQMMAPIADKQNPKQIMMGMLSSLLTVASSTNTLSLISAVTEEVLSQYKRDEVYKICQQYLDPRILLVPKYELPNDISSFKVTWDHQLQEKIIAELDYTVSVFNGNSIQKLNVKLDNFSLHTWLILNSTMNIPGHNGVVLGPEGSGRFSLTVLASNTNEADFVTILPPNLDDGVTIKERMDTISGIIRDVVSNTINNHKKTNIFIRESDVNQLEVRIIKAFATSFDFVPYFNDQQLEDLYTHFANVSNLNPEMRRQTMQKIQLILSASIHLIIGTDHFNNNEATFDVIKPFDKEEIISTNIIENYIQNKDLPDAVVPDKKSTSQLFLTTLEALKKLNISISTNNLRDFLSTFKKTVTQDYQEIESRHESLASALKFLQDIKNDSETINSTMKDIVPRIQKLRVDTDILEQSYLTRKEAIEARRIKLDEDKKDKEANLQQTLHKLNELEQQHSTLKPEAEKCYSTLEQMTKNEVETILITIGTPQPQIITIFESLAILLSLPKPYFDNCMQALKSENFAASLRKNSQEQLGIPKVVENVKNMLDTANINPRDLDNICPQLRWIFDWADTVVRLAILEDNLMKMKKTYEEDTIMLNEFITEMDLEIQSINQVEESLVNEKQEVAAQNIAREKMEKDYAQITERKERIDSLSKDVDLLQRTWEETNNKYPTKKSQIFGDSFAFSFYLIFCGVLNREKRLQAMNEMTKILKNANIPVSYEDPIKFVNDKLILLSTIDDIVHYESVPCNSLMADVQHCFTTIRTPLLVDPDGIVQTIMTDSIKAKRIIVCSATSSSIESSVQTALSDGKILFVTDTINLPSCVEQAMIVSLTSDRSTGREIKVGSKVVQWDPKFKLILVTTTPVKDLPESLKSRVVIVDVTSTSDEATEEMFTNMFIDFFFPALTPKVQEMRKKELSQHSLVQKFENDVLDTLSDIAATRKLNEKYDYLADKDVIQDIITSKNNYFECIAGNTDFKPLLKELSENIKIFKPHINLCQIFWRVLTRFIVPINPTARSSFQNYLKIISAPFVTGGLHAGVPSSDQHTFLRNSIINSTFSFIFPTIKVSEMYFFMFVSAFMMFKSDGKASDDDLTAILDHISKERFDTADFNGYDPKDEGSFEGLKFTNILSIFTYMRAFIWNTYGEGFDPLLPHFQVESVVSNQGSVPSVIIADPNNDPTGSVLPFISSRCRHDNFDELSLSDNVEQIKYIKKVVTTSMNRPNWVLLHYTRPNRAASQFITDIFTTMMTSSINTNFRLIVIASSLDDIPASVLLRAKRYTLDDSGTLKNTMHKFFGNYSSHIMSSSNPQGIKRLSYLSLLNATIALFRNQLQPNLGYITRLSFPETAVRDIIKEMHQICDSYINVLPMAVAANRVSRILYSGIMDTLDYEVCKSMTSFLFDIRAINDGFNLSRDPTLKDIWSMPGDIQLSDYTNVIHKLPMWCPPSIFGAPSIAAHSLVQWSVNQCITKPFIDILNATTNRVMTAAKESLFAKYDNIEMLLPVDCPYPSEIAWTMRTEFLVREIKKLNDGLVKIRQSLRRSKKLAMSGVYDDIAFNLVVNQTPDDWKRMANYYVTNQVNKFATHIIERHALLTAWSQGVIPQTVDVSLIDDVRDLLAAFLAEVAIRTNIPQGNLTYEFSFGGTAGENSIILSRLYSSLANIDEGKIDRPEKELKAPFKHVPELVCTVIDSAEKPFLNRQPIPLLKFAGAEQLGFRQGVTFDGHNENFAWMLDLQTDVKHTLIGFGTALYCRVASQFV